MKVVRKLGAGTWLGLGLALITAWVYRGVIGFNFINYDDPGYVSTNPKVLAGLTWQGVQWAFTHFWMANWHPLTWLSYMADVSLFGPDPGMLHLVNLGFHILNVVLLFVLLRRLTGALWLSAFVAALFAVHPVHVESVAWVAERKDVLSMCFGLLTLLAYGRYVRTGSKGSYWGAWVLYALGLMAKPMLVSLPILMILLDFWPLERLRSRKELLRRTLEKGPFFLLALGSCILTVMAQHRGHSIVPMENMGLKLRAVNSLLGYGRYLAHMVWPRHLIILYPMEPLGRIAPLAWVSAAVLGAVSFAAFRLRERMPYLLMGWLWFLISLVPVIGLVQVGRQAIADRYTYLPLIGPFLALAWLGAALAKRWRVPAYASGAAMVAITAVLMALAQVQVGYWKDTLTLFNHCLATTGEASPIPFANIGFTYFQRGRFQEAVEAYSTAIRVSPKEYISYELRGDALHKLGRDQEALDSYGQALSRNHNAYNSAYGAARILVALHREEEALVCFRWYLGLEPWRLKVGLDPDQQRALSQECRMAIGLTLKRLGRVDEEIAAFRDALAHAPRDAQAMVNLGMALGDAGRHPEALQLLERASQLAPRQPLAHARYGLELARAGRSGDARREFAKALALDPADATAKAGLLKLDAGRP